jgi:DNA-binding response OmpR family regulator
MLVVDDEETIRWALRELFMQDGWEVHDVGDGDEAAGMICAHTYDYMITDLKLPGCSGVEILEGARKRNPRMGVTVLTGYASLDTAVQALRLGAWDYVTKPCKAPELKDRIDEFFECAGRQPARLTAGGSLAQEDLADFAAGAGTEVLSLSTLEADRQASSVFGRLRGMFTDLGFRRERAEELVQFCIEAAAVLPDSNGGSRGRAGLLKGHVVVSVTGHCDAGDAELDMLRKVGEQFGVDTRIVRSDGRCSVVLSEAI